MKIIYIPLDERPCNYQYPIRAVKTVNKIEVVVPDPELLGYKKKEANSEKIWSFIKRSIKDNDILVISAEMLMYGGLVPSRLHHKNISEQTSFYNKLIELKEMYPDITIYLSNLIMRTPQYNSADEEPDYYEEHGLNIFKIGMFIDKTNRGTITELEVQEFNRIQKIVPQDIISDFCDRREFNKKLTLKLIDLVKIGIIDFMVIPQDDSHEFGFTAMDQNEIYPQINNLNLSEKVLVYPGADEVGYELLARATNQIYNRTPKIYVEYSSLKGPFIIPTYEDREIGESLKSHVLVTGSRLVHTPEEADFILAYNTPGEMMIESSMQKTDLLISFDRNRNLSYFVSEVKRQIRDGKKVVICDAAFSNGGDIQLLEMLASDSGVISKIQAYRGWNTNCNTLGSALAEGIFSLNSNEKLKRDNNIACICDDIFYQAIIRGNIAGHELSQRGLDYFDLKEKKDEIKKIVIDNISRYMNVFLHDEFPDFNIDNLTIDFPWNRMFEIYCDYTSK